MQGVHAVEHDSGGTGAGERGGDFLADVAGFADADDDDFGAPAQRFDNHFHRAVKRGVELGAHGFERGDFDVKHFSGLVKMAHRGKFVMGAGHFQPCFSR